MWRRGTFRDSDPDVKAALHNKCRFTLLKLAFPGESLETRVYPVSEIGPPQVLLKLVPSWIDPDSWGTGEDNATIALSDGGLVVAHNQHVQPAVLAPIVMYSVADLDSAHAKLVSTIVNGVFPDAWEDAGGDARIELVGSEGVLLVKAQEPVQRAIRETLKDLRLQVLDRSTDP